MPGNTTSLYSSTGSSATVSGTNTSGLYGGTGSYVVGTAAYGNVNVAAFLQSYTGNLQAGNANILGNLAAGGVLTDNYYYANGAPISFAGTYGNANVANFLPTYTGNLQAGNLEVINDGNISNDLYVGGTIYGTFSGNISGNLVVPGVNTDVIFNNAGNAGASSDFQFNDATNVLTVNGTANVNTLNATGNITGSYFIGNGSQLTGLPASYSNANVATFLANFGSNVISTTGNITGGNIIGNGQFLTNLPGANVTGTVANATYALNANAATFAGTVTTNAQPNITSVGNLTSLTVTGNLSGDNLILTGNIFYGNSPEPIGLGRVNPFTDYVYNNSGFNLVFSIPSAGTWLIDFTVTAEIDHSSSADDVLSMGLFDSANTQIGNAFTVIAAYTTAVGQIASSGSGQYIVTTTGPTTYYGNSVVNQSVSVGTAFGSLVQLDAPVVMESISYTGNLNFAGNITANAGNITASSFLVGNNASVNNAITAQTITATGNVTGQYIIGDGSLLTNINAGNITGAYGNANVSNFLANGFGSNTITTTGNVTAAQFNGNLQGKVLDSSQTGIQIIGNDSSATSTAIYGNGISILPLIGSDMFVLATGANTDIVIGGSGANANGALYIGQNPLSSSPMPTVLSSTDTYVQGNLRNNLGNIAIIDNVDVTGAVSATGNITGSYILGNGSQLTGITGTYGNSNVANYLPTYTGNIGAGNVIFTNNTGRLYVNEIQGLSGAGLSIAADGTENINLNADTVRVGDNNTDATVTTHGTGDMIINTNDGTNSGNIRIFDGVNGNIDINPNGTGAVNISGTAGLRVADGISATGNITGSYFIGNGSQLTGITATANLAGNMTGDISGQNLYNISGLTSLSASNVATDTISSPSGDFVTIEGVIATNGGQMSGNLVFNNQQGVILREQTSSGTNYVQLKSYPSLSTDTIYLLPSDGANGQVLTTSGTGNLSWTTVSGGSSSNSFSTIAANGTNIVATSSTDTLTLTAGTNITITGNAATDTITISAAGGGGSLSGNLAGNIFANGFAFTSESNGNVIITANGTGQLQTSKQKMATFAETVYAMGNVTGNLAANIDINNGSIQTMTLTGNITANSIQNMAAGQSITMIMTQDATGSRTLSSTMKWSGGYKTLTTTASATDIATIFYDGTTYYASLSRGYA